MTVYSVSVIACVAMFVGMLSFTVVGHRAGRRRLLRDADANALNTGTVDAAVLSLLGLLVAFTFSSAYSRFDTRRQLIVQEANAIGTAYLRLDLLPDRQQPELRNTFRDYVGSRYELWKKLPDRDEGLAEFTRSERLQGQIWTAAVAASERDNTARMLLLPAINEMIDVTNTRLIAVQSHPPLIVFLLLGALSLASAWLAGYAMAKSDRPSRMHVIGFAVVASAALYVILDIEYPRQGLVRLDAPHELLIDLQKRMP